MPPRTRRSATERRGEIAEETLRLLGRGGLGAVTAVAVAAAAGVSPAALFRHFETLAEMVEAAVGLAVDRLDATLPAPDGAPVARLRALAEARVRPFEEEPGVAWLLRSEQAYASLPESPVVTLRGALGRSRRSTGRRPYRSEGPARTSNGDASPAFARCARIRSITARSVIHAITFIAPPHFAQTSGSTSKTFFNTLAHAERRFASGEPGSAGITGSGATDASGVPAPAIASDTTKGFELHGAELSATQALAKMTVVTASVSTDDLAAIVAAAERTQSAITAVDDELRTIASATMTDADRRARVAAASTKRDALVIEFRTHFVLHLRAQTRS